VGDKAAGVGDRGSFHWRGELVDKRNLNKCFFPLSSTRYEQRQCYVHSHTYKRICIFSYVTGIRECLSQPNLNSIPSKTSISNWISCWVGSDYWVYQPFSFPNHMLWNLELLSYRTIRESIKCPFKESYFYEI